MSMSDFVSGGAGCGPSNPLQSLGKRFGQDRSTQHDTFASASSAQARNQRSSFRSSAGPSSHQPSFFAAPESHQSPFAAPSTAHDAFDVSQLRGNLPTGSHTPVFRHTGPGPSTLSHLDSSFRPAHHAPAPTVSRAPRSINGTWANDFLRGESPSAQTQQMASPRLSDARNEAQAHQSMPVLGMRMGMMPSIQPMHFSPSHVQPLDQHNVPHVAQRSQSSAASDQLKWTEAFTAFDASSEQKFSSTSNPVQTSTEQVETQAAAPTTDYNDPVERDELARTAGRLVSSVEHDQSAKFRQSNFLDLMRKIRDKQAGIQGSDIVENADMPGSLSNKGKARAQDPAESVSSSTPRSQQEAYDWANQMASGGQAHKLPPSLQRTSDNHTGSQSMIPPVLNAEQEISNRQALNDLWAEEDARSEAIERQAMHESAQNFVGDGGDIAARMREDDAEAREFARYQRLGANIPHTSTFDRRWEEDMGRGAQQDDDDQDFVGRRWEGAKGRGYPGAQTAEWDKLQSDWDNFEVTSAGIRPVQKSQPNVGLSASSLTRNAPAYRFLSENPYIASTRQHAAHSGGIPAGLESVLEKEAAVQQDPENASAWYDLGVKQQENEREVQAIAALQKALQLDSTYKEAWLALAVSYTNENDRTAAYDAIERWIDRNEKYAEITSKLNAELLSQTSTDQRDRSDSVSSHSTSSSIVEKHSRLTNLLIAMARHGGERGEVDADVQVALGVLFNSSEDYDKAVDCFSTALSVRPTDWLLYNRLGATLSNSGRSAEAIAYYHHALNLQPEFVRCHFNLSISCLNLKDAAEHIYTALTLQQAEVETLDMVSTPGDPNRPSSATSGSLWETFRVALELLNRSDLAAKCYSRDINAFDPNDLVAPLPSSSFASRGGDDHGMSDY
ncbi:TPR-like protein [Testicularia cyperi]|uniref:TPR-like protein n=1 Tax=Testicularia cyperi TaxID=1882483 RepID=A0A317XW42_9BASI|nr:TPR-like protein [Testicularia cyperi]